MKLREVRANQKGWELAKGWLMEIRITSMGFAPLVVHDEERYKKKIGRKQVICLNLSEMEKIWATLPKRDVKLEEVNLMVNMEQKLCVIVGGNFGDECDTESLYLVLNAEQEIKDGTPFVYADEGIWILKDMSNAKFPDMKKEEV